MNFSQVQNKYKCNFLFVKEEIISYLELGEGSKIIICLHGFPDHPYTFDNQVSSLIELGYKVFIPYLRGFSNDSGDVVYDKSIENCDIQLGYDLINFITELKLNKVTLLGHDIGSAAVYAAVTLQPDLFVAAITLSVPYGDVLYKAILKSDIQQKKYWYFFLITSSFGTYGISFNKFAFIDNLWNSWTRLDWKIDEQELVTIKSGISKNYKLITNYYQNCFKNNFKNIKDEHKNILGRKKITIPFLYLHGVDDQCIDISVAREINFNLFQDLEYEEIEEAGHFLHREQHIVVNDLIKNFLKRVNL